MGSAAAATSPGGKRAPAKRSVSAKARVSKPRGGLGAEPPASTASSAAAGHHHRLRVPTDLPVCVVDNGGWTVKYGLAIPAPPEPPPTAPPPSSLANGQAASGDDKKSSDAATDGSGGGALGPEKMSSMLNATARPPHQLAVLAGDEITSRMKNLGQLSWTLPLERGMVVDGEAQLRVWARVLEAVGVVPVPAVPAAAGGGFLATIAAARRGKLDPAAVERRMTYSSNNCAFLLLEPPLVPSAISEGVDCILFRELGMARVARMVGPCMAAVKYLSLGKDINDADVDGEWINDGTECCCVVDSGHSFTHVVPSFCGEALIPAIRRLDVGGKVLTGLLKECFTYRQWNMMDETHVVNDAKEQLCFVSNNFDEEMREARRTRKGLRWFDREYLLPDFVNTFRGSVRLPEPLQRKREMEEIERMRCDMERRQGEKEQQELEDDAKDLTRMQEEESSAGQGMAAEDFLDNKKGKRPSRSSKSKKEKRKRKHKWAEETNASKGDGEDEGDAIGDSDDESDEETDRQRLQRLKAMRDAERRRREKESLDRQALAMSVERFAIPEVLLRPSDIGMDCGGVAEAIAEAVDACDPTLRAAMYHNVLLVGGNARIPGYRDRVELELRSLAPTNYAVRVHLPEDPVSYAWEGAKEFSRRPGFQEQFSVDRLSWEVMKKAGKNQQDIWGRKMYHIGVQPHFN